MGLDQEIILQDLEAEDMEKLVDETVKDLKKESPDVQNAVINSLSVELGTSHPIRGYLKGDHIQKAENWIDDLSYNGLTDSDLLKLKIGTYEKATGRRVDKKDAAESVSDVSAEQLRKYRIDANAERAVELKVQGEIAAVRKAIEKIQTPLDIMKVGVGTEMSFIDRDGVYRSYTVTKHDRRKGKIFMTEVDGSKKRIIEYDAIPSTTKGLVDVRYIEPRRPSDEEVKKLNAYLETNEDALASASWAEKQSARRAKKAKQASEKKNQ